MLQLDELLDLCEQIELRSKSPWTSSPSESDLRMCLSEAERLAGYNPTRAEEAAALFYALSFHEHVLGDARFQMPAKAFYVQISVSGLQLALHDIPRLRNLQDEIAAGDVPWEQARDWFERRLRPR